MGSVASDAMDDPTKPMKLDLVVGAKAIGAYLGMQGSELGLTTVYDWQGF